MSSGHRDSGHRRSGRDRSYSPERERSHRSHREHSSKTHRDRERDRDRGDDEDMPDRERRRDRESDRARRGERDSARDEERGDGHRRRDRDHERDEGKESKRRKRDRDRDREEADEGSEEEDLLDLRDLGVKEITEEDYFLKSAEFKYWLKEERSKYLDELSSESAHKYFRKFVRRWNDGALMERYYRPPPTASSSSNTAYKWSFASNRSRVDSSALANIRADVDRMTHAQASGPLKTNMEDDDGDDDEDDIVGPTPGPTLGPSLPPSGTGSRNNTGGGARLGPSLPSASDRQLALESQHESRRMDRKALNRERYERADELVPRSGGKEGKMEEKRAVNAQNRQMRDKEVGGLELDEGELMGGGDGTGSGSTFAAALRAREAAKNRREDKRAIDMADRRAATDERLAERRAKESATMDMFKALAKQRFG